MSHRYYRYAFSMSQLCNAYANDSKSCKLSEVLLKRIQQRGTRYRIPEVERWWNKPLSHEARRNITRSNVISSNVVQWNVIAAAVYHLISHAARYYVASAREQIISCILNLFFIRFYISPADFLWQSKISVQTENIDSKEKVKFVCQISCFT